MRRSSLYAALVSLLLFSACKQARVQRVADPCDALSKEEIAAAQGSAINEIIKDAHSENGLRIVQCRYLAADNVKSVFLQIYLPDPASASPQHPRDFWKQTFGSAESDEKSVEDQKDTKIDNESVDEKDERRGRFPPKEIKGVGDRAYWVVTSSAFYALQDDVFIRLVVGGTDDEEAMISKAKLLAQKALSRL